MTLERHLPGGFLIARGTPSLVRGMLVRVSSLGGPEHGSGRYGMFLPHFYHESDGAISKSSDLTDEL